LAPFILINVATLKGLVDEAGIRVWAGILLVTLSTYSLQAADLKQARSQFLAGDYTNCIASAEDAVEKQPDEEDWQVLLSQALMATGQYPRALSAITNALHHNSWGLRLRWQARQVFESNGQRDSAAEMVDNITRMVASQPRAYREAADLVVFGRAALLKGADPKRVLDTLFDAAKKSDPTLRDSYLAAGELALDKHDFALAAKNFEAGVKQVPDDPDLHCGLAQAYAPSDTSLAVASLNAALDHNSNHLGSLLLLVDHSIDSEEYSQAESYLNRIQAFNPLIPDAWAYRAVLAHLRNQPKAESEARETGLKYWPSNPRVDYLIGLKLSQNYRFVEGAAHQKQALAFDANYLPAKGQLAQDLLRLGDENEGWKLAQEAQKEDAYDIALFNLTTLHDTMQRFATVTNGDFILRMNSREAAIYGEQALDLLTRAKTNLCAKYGYELPGQAIVEIFNEQKDFAVRTFGMPGNPGYLGVCFGNLITANSPAAHVGHNVNWHAVLYHEFCHVVTLQLTHNKMPRWLSEGISVYEERQANPSWGERINPRYREMILDNELTPVSKLSAAFMAPRSPIHLQFAYYESSLVVEFLVQRFGFDQLKGLLADLGEGMEINQAIEKHTVAMKDLETDFASFARDKALAMAPGLDWEKPGLKELLHEDSDLGAFSMAPTVVRTNQSSSTPKRPRSSRSRGDDSESAPAEHQESANTLAAWIASHPTNYYALSEQARKLIEEKDFPAAKKPLEKLIELYPTETGSDSSYAMMAFVHRSLGETNAEREVLSRLSRQDDEAKDAYLRLMELCSQAGDWAGVVDNAKRYLAVDPLTTPPYRYLARASEQSGDLHAAVTAYQGLIQLDPPDPAEVHFRLAQALHRLGDPSALRHTLQALEEAPRYRAALALLLQIHTNAPPAEPSPAPAAQTTP
jgi:tetratricopeptide (TPR) repeat protein